jgi:hypothetical protein
MDRVAQRLVMRPRFACGARDRHHPGHRLIERWCRDPSAERRWNVISSRFTSRQSVACCAKAAKSRQPSGAGLV